MFQRIKVPFPQGNRMRFSRRSTALLLITASLSALPVSANEGNACLTPDERERLLALDMDAFDQDMQGGWRVLAATPGCQVTAAELIRDWREKHQRSDAILFWHEAQVRAETADTEGAIALFRQSLKPDAPGNRAWNAYVEATLAFMAKDRPALLRAHETLLQVEPPEDMEVKDGKVDVTMDNGQTYTLRWPPNIDVVEGLMHCFDADYATAYGQACRKAGAPVGHKD